MYRCIIVVIVFQARFAIICAVYFIPPAEYFAFRSAFTFSLAAISSSRCLKYSALLDTFAAVVVDFGLLSGCSTQN